MSYAGLDSLNAALKSGLDTFVATPEVQTRLQRLLDLATDVVRFWCRREFTPTDGSRTFDAPNATRLGLPGLITLTAVSAFGSPVDLAAVRLHPISPGVGRPASYSNLEYRPAGVPTVWDSAMDAAVFDPWGQIVVTGLWGYDTTIPPGVQHVTKVLAERAYLADVALNKSPAGPISTDYGRTILNAAQIDSDPELVMWLRPYRWECC